MTRRPQLLGFMTIQPVLLVLMFRYVFGGSIHTPGASYTNYLMAEIFVTTVLFGAQNTAIGMAEDLHSGLIERFQSLVMARSAVLAGRVLADALRNVFVIAFMLGVGYLVGFRLHTNAAARSQPARAREGVDRGSHDRAGRAHCRGSRRVIIGRREGQPRSSVRTSRGNGHAGVPRPGRRRGSSRAQIADQQRLGGQRPSNCGPRGRRTPAC